MADARARALALLDEADAAGAPAAAPADAKGKALSLLDAADAADGLMPSRDFEIAPEQPARPAAAPGAGASPLPPPEPRRVAPALGGYGGGAALNQGALARGGEDLMRTEPPDPISQKAAAAGVLYDKPAPAGHALASLAYDDEEKANAYREALKAHYGRDTPVRMGEQTGALEFYDPDAGRWALVDPPDRSHWGDVTGAAGGSMVMIPELVTGTLAAATTKSPALTVLAGSGGAAIGEINRLLLGSALGINQKMTDGQIAAAALGQLGESAAAGFAGEKMVQLVKGLRHAWKGDAVAFARYADKLGIDPTEAAKVQSEINDALQAERMRIAGMNADLPPALQRDLPRELRYTMTLGEASGNADMLTYQDMIKRSPTFQARFGEFDQERQQALKQFYDLLNRPFNRSVIGEQGAVERVKEVARTGLEYAKARANEHMARYQADAALALTDVKTLPVYALGDVAQTVGRAEQDAFRGRASEMAARIREVAGGAKFVQNTNLAATLDSLDAETKNVVFQSLRTARKRARQIPPRTIEGAEGEAVLHPLFDPGSTWSFNQSWDTISELKRVVREAAEGTTTETPDVGAMQKLIGAMEQDLFESAANTELGPMYRHFTQWYRREKMRLDGGVVGDILKREGGRAGPFAVASEEVFRRVFPATNARGGFGIAATREFMHLIKNDPQAVGAFRQAIADDWRRSVVDPQTGRVNPVRHRQWLDQHSEQLDLTFPGSAPEERAVADAFGMTIVQPRNTGEPLFTLAERRAIHRAEGFEQALQARERDRDEALAAINETFGAKLANLDSMGQLLNVVRGRLDGQGARDLVRMLDRPGTLDVLRGVRAAYVKDMSERVMTSRVPVTREPILNPLALQRFLYGKSGEAERGQIAVIRELFGDTYVNGLTTLEKALSATAREAPAPNRSGSGLWWTVAKAVTRMKFGQISREGLMLSQAERVHKAAAEAAIARAVMNPTDMQRLMSIWNADIRDRKTAAVLLQLGVSAADLGVDTTE